MALLLKAPSSLPFRRFHHSLTNNNRWIRERSHESYAKNYSVVFPYDEPLAGRNMRKDPLHEVRGPTLVGRDGLREPGIRISLTKACPSTCPHSCKSAAIDGPGSVTAVSHLASRGTIKQHKKPTTYLLRKGKTGSRATPGLQVHRQHGQAQLHEIQQLCSHLLHG